MERREPSYTVGGNVRWCSHHGNSMKVPQKTKNTITIVVAVAILSLSGI